MRRRSRSLRWETLAMINSWLIPPPSGRLWGCPSSIRRWRAITLEPGARERFAGAEASTTGIAARPREPDAPSDREDLDFPDAPPPDCAPLDWEPAKDPLTLADDIRAGGIGSAAKGVPSRLGATIERSPDIEARSSGRIATISTPSATSRLDSTTASGPSSVRICLSASAGLSAT